MSGRLKRIRILVPIIVLVCVGTLLLWPRLPRAASIALDDADRFELLSLDPERADATASDLFYWHRVFGTLSVDEPATRAKLKRALSGGVESVFTSVNRCFMPRHGIRVTHAGITTEFLICFECKQVLVFAGGRRGAGWITDSSPQPTFDEVLRAGLIPLAPE